MAAKSGLHVYTYRGSTRGEKEAPTSAASTARIAQLGSPRVLFASVCPVPELPARDGDRAANSRRSALSAFTLD